MGKDRRSVHNVRAQIPEHELRKKEGEESEERTTREGVGAGARKKEAGGAALRFLSRKREGERQRSAALPKK